MSCGNIIWKRVTDAMYPSLIVHTIKLATIILLLIAFEGANATNYYISYRRGRDSWKGTSVSKPWKSLEKISQLTFSPGDSILLECGNSWNGHIQLNGSGEANNPIVLASFGEGEKPILNGSGNHYTILIRNQEYWRILGLEITNFDEREEGIDLWAWEMRNKNIWASSIEPLAPFKDARNQKHAILVEAIDVGCVNGLYFKNLEIHGVNGAMSTKHNGGIFLAVRGDRIATWFDDLVVEGCYIHDVDRTGISNISSWNNRTLTRNVNWVPSKNIVIRNNVFERTGANALIVRVAEGPIIEYNLFDHCSIKGSGNANFPFNCDHAVIRFNEARFTKYNLGDADAGGFDSDYRCKNTVIEYNYSHHNEFGGILICCMGGDDESRFNYGTKIRYNIFEDNKHHTIRVSGKTSNTAIHDNYIVSHLDSTSVIWHKSWRGYADKTIYRNNLFLIHGKGTVMDLGASTGNEFSDNLYIGHDPLYRQIDREEHPLNFFDRIPDRFYNLIPKLEKYWSGKHENFLLKER